MKLKWILGSVLFISSIASAQQDKGSNQSTQQKDPKAKPASSQSKQGTSSSGSVKRVPESKTSNKAVIKPRN